MALITRTINNTGAPLTDVNGAVLALTPIRFTLVNSRSYAAGTFDATTGEPVAPGPYLATTDEGGLFSVDLWPTSRGLEERFYLVEIAPDSDSVEFPAFKAPLADGGGALPFLSFRLGGDTVAAWELDAFTAHVNNMELHTPSGTGHTHDNKAILDQISESVGKLTYNGTLVGISDHGGLAGLADDDHTQYLNSTRHSAITGNPHSTTPADIGAAALSHTHAGFYEPANANIQSHITSIANPHSVTAAQVGIANKSTLDKITESAGLPLWNGTAWPGGSAGGGDMYKSAYDTDNDGIVDAAESAPWAGITGKPSTYPPGSHTHDDRYYTESEVNSLLGGKSDTTHNHSGVYQPVMGADDNYVTDAEKSALHSHSNKTALDAVTGTNTGDQDLSGYSLTSHNHSLANLAEKSYNSLTDKPSIPSISGLLDETAHDLLDHTGLTGIPAAYSLPTASTTVLGGVKVDGTTVTISNGVISSSGGSGMTNPMTTAGDIIYGGTNGAPTRLAKGADAEVLTLVNGVPAWAKFSFGGLIGTAGAQGFGVGVYNGTLPSGFSAMTGTTDPASDNYGNYQYSDGSVMCFVPRFYYRIGSASSPRYATYGANAVDIVGIETFADEAAANAAGYAMHRAFIDGGEVKSGFFVDKYMCSPNGTTSGKSVKNGVPISLTTTTTYTRSATMTGCTGILADAVILSRARGAGFNTASIFMYSALALLSLAHGQAATAATYCAWYDAAGTTNFPKGCNNGSLADHRDATVTFTTAGDSGTAAKPLTGSASNLAKTTHNGQNCGVADLNGALYQVMLGLTDFGTSATDTTQHTNGNVYLLKTSVALSSLTAGWDGATDAWGNTTSLATKYDAVTGLLPWGSASGWLYMGNGTNRVLDPATSGAGYQRTSCGIPQDTNAMSAGGTNLYGNDVQYQYNRANLVPLASGGWLNAADAGLFYRYWVGHRSYDSYNFGFRASCYGV